MKEIVDKYDVVIIGAGIAGYSAALKAVKRNKRVALIENDQVGGTCLNKGCIPTKSLLFYARNYENAYKMYHAGILNEPPSLNESGIISEIQNTITKLRKGLTYTLEHSGINIFEGKASIPSQDIVKVVANDDSVICLKTGTVIIATGSKPMIPEKLSRLVGDFVDHTDNIFSKDWLRSFETITIIGGGVVGVEFANALSMLGKNVYVIEKTDRLLSTFPISLSRYVENLLKRRGIHIICGAEISSISEEDDEIILKLSSLFGKRVVFSDRLMFATGRSANIEFLDDSEINIQMNGDLIKVDRNYATNIEGIYAIGDVSSNIQLAYIASKQAEDVVDFIIDGTSCPNIACYPQCVFISPEVATVGMSEEDVILAGKKCIVGKASMSVNGKAVLEDCADGFMKIIMDFDTHTVIGGQFVCENAVELSELLFQYIRDHVTGENILEAIFPHPSIVEHVRTAIFNGLRAGD